MKTINTYINNNYNDNDIIIYFDMETVMFYFFTGFKINKTICSRVKNIHESYYAAHDWLSNKKRFYCVFVDYLQGNIRFSTL